VTTTGRGGDTAGDVAKPWDLAEEDLPRRVTPEWIAENLAANNWDVVRTHLVPTRKNEPYMASWRALWRTLAFDPRWVDQVTRRLRRDQQIAQSAIGSGALDEKAEQDAKDFIREANEAITRMGNESEQAMAWAGAKYARHTPIIRETLEALVVAVDDHRAGQVGDQELHSALQALRLDPVAGHGISDRARERARRRYRGEEKR